MKTTLIVSLTILAAIARTFAAEPTKTEAAASIAKATESKAWFSDVTLEPYGTVSWRGIDGKATLGAGANVVSHITKGFSLWGFGESDNTAHSTIDRAGLGIRYEGHLGKHIHGDAGIAFGYDIEGTSNTSLVKTDKGRQLVTSKDQFAFVRLPVGLTLDLLQSEYFDAGIRAAYAFDISGEGKNGLAFGRAFIGPVATFKW